MKSILKEDYNVFQVLLRAGVRRVRGAALPAAVRAARRGRLLRELRVARAPQVQSRGTYRSHTYTTLHTPDTTRRYVICGPLFPSRRIPASSYRFHCFVMLVVSRVICNPRVIIARTLAASARTSSRVVGCPTDLQLTFVFLSAKLNFIFLFDV